MKFNHRHGATRRFLRFASLQAERLEDRVLLAADMFEPNDTDEAAFVHADLGSFEQFHTGLSIDTTKDQDWYVWRPVSEGPATAAISFEHKRGDLGLEVFDGQRQLLDRSATDTDNESVTWKVAPGETYFVHVFGMEGATQDDYAMFLDMEGQWIGRDRLDQAVGRNNQFATATELDSFDTLLEKSLTLDFDPREGIVDEADMYRWIAPASGTLTIDLVFRHDLGNVDVQLFDARQNRLASSTSSTDNETLMWAVSADQPYFVRVFGANQAASPGYDLQLHLETVLVVTNRSDDGPGSLRQAIEHANESPGPDTITFAIGRGLQAIAPASPLPPLLDPVVMDATTQPGYVGTPLIEIRGANSGASAGLRLETNASTITGLAIFDFEGSGIQVVGSDNQIQGNFIAKNRGAGVSVLQGVNNAIGQNLFSLNGGLGIDLQQDGTTANDTQDGDDGPNHLQNFPDLVSAIIVDNQMIEIAYSVDAAPNNAAYPLDVELYVSDTEAGHRYLGTDIYDSKDYDQGVKLFAIPVGMVAVGEQFVATSTDAAGNTSEFSIPVEVVRERGAVFISDIPDQSTDEDISTGAIFFTVGAAQIEPAELVVTALSDNPSLVPADAIQLAGTGDRRTVQITPASDQWGRVTIFLTVQHPNGQTASDSFILTVAPVNDAPVNTVPVQQTMEEDAKLVFSKETGNSILTRDVDAGIGNLLAELSVDAGSLTLADTASLTQLTGNGTGRVSIEGTLDAMNRALDGLTYAPPPDFVAAVTLTFTTDDQGSSGRGGPAIDTDEVSIFVSSVDDPPVISEIPDQRTIEGDPTEPAAFRIIDVDTPGVPLLVQATSTNPRLVPPGNIVLGGAGVNRTIVVIPARHQIGTAEILITVDDGRGGVATETFHVTVDPLPDRDGDGLIDRWEIEGLDFNEDGIIDLDLPGLLGADPDRKDLFVEVDAMLGRAPSLLTEPHPEVPPELATGTVLDNVIAAFLAAPVANPDNSTGINLHIQLDETDIPRLPFSLGWDEFDAIKCGADNLCEVNSPSQGHFGTVTERAEPNWENVSAAKSLVYRYGLFADRRGTEGMAGLAERPGNDFLVTLGDWLTPAGQPGGSVEDQTGTFMHELGHTLGLAHGGGDETSYKPNYHSVMNYHWQVPSRNTGWALDYSRQVLPTLNEAKLTETAGLGFPVGSLHDLEDHMVHVGPSFKTRIPLVGPVDFNGDGDTSDTAVTLDVNNDGEIGLIPGHNDWQNLVFTFRDTVSFEDGVHTCSALGDEDCDDVQEQDQLDPVNAYAVLEDEFEPNDSREEVDDLADLESDDTRVDATVHDAANDDWYQWTAPIQGILEILLEKDQDAELDLTLALHDALGTILSTGTLVPGLESDMFQVESDVTGATTYYMTATSPDTGYYSLHVDAPEVWDGDASAGTPGDGTRWDAPDNWTADGVHDDRVPDETDHVTFNVASASRSVTLESLSRTVKSLTFLGDYTISNGTLDVSSGVVSVDAGVTTTLAWDLTIPGGIVKADEGTLLVAGQLGGFNEVLDGTLGGTGTLSSLLVQPDGAVAPGASMGTMNVTGAVTILGSMLAEVGGTGADRISASGPVTLDESTLVVSALSSLRLGGGDLEVGETARTLISGSSVTGSFSTLPADGQHVDYGVFIRQFENADSPVRYNATSVEIALLQAAPGDANGDRQFNQIDIIQVLQGTKYLSGQPATWLEGDWDGNGLFNQLDLVAALQAANYLQGPYAALRPGAGLAEANRSTAASRAAADAGRSRGPGLTQDSSWVVTANVFAQLGTDSHSVGDEHVSRPSQRPAQPPRERLDPPLPTRTFSRAGRHQTQRFTTASECPFQTRSPNAREIDTWMADLASPLTEDSDGDA